MKGLAIYVSSYDGCSDLWNTFFEIFDTFWSKCNFPIYLVNNQKPYEHKNIKVISTGAEVHWFDRNIRALEEVKEEYILFMLEDYFISKNINNNEFYKIVQFMQSHNSFYYQLSFNGEISRKDSKIIQVNSHIKYPISLQPAIWNKEYLLKILKNINMESPWDFENYFKKKYEETVGVISGAFCDMRDILGYKNGVLRGKWIPTTIKYFEKKEIYIDLGEREQLSKRDEFKYMISSWVSYHVPENIKRIIKGCLKAFHIDYLR